MLLVGVWVILSNLLPMLNIRVPNSALILALLGIVAGRAVARRPLTRPAVTTPTRLALTGGRRGSVAP